MFWGQASDDPERKIDTTFSVMQAKAELPGAGPDAGEEPESMYGDQPFMVNLRVTDIDAVLDHLAAKGVEPLKREDESYGRFAWIRDGDGNRVEIYQPLAAE